MGKQVTIAAALVALLLIVGYAAYSMVFAEVELPPVVDAGAPTASVPTEAPAQKVAVKVVTLEGTAERRTPGGEWKALEIGDVLAESDELRTSEDGRVVLDIGGQSKLQVAENTQFSTADMSTKLSQLKLTGGRISATVRGNGPRMQVAVEGSDAVAVAEDGEFSVLSGGEGDVVVATESGNVELTAQGKKVDVGAGTLSLVEKGKAPSKPEKIPGTLFLKISRPDKILYRTSETVAVKGKTTPGAIVSVNGVRAQVDADGNFEAEVTLKEGKNDIKVSANDVLGRKEGEQGQPILVDSRPPKVQSEVTF